MGGKFNSTFVRLLGLDPDGTDGSDASSTDALSEPTERSFISGTEDDPDAEGVPERALIQDWMEKMVKIRVESFDRRGTEPFEFFQNRNFS